MCLNFVGKWYVVQLKKKCSQFQYICVQVETSCFLFFKISKNERSTLNLQENILQTLFEDSLMTL